MIDKITFSDFEMGMIGKDFKDCYKEISDKMQKDERELPWYWRMWCDITKKLKDYDTIRIAEQCYSFGKVQARIENNYNMAKQFGYLKKDSQNVQKASQESGE